jgi:Protein of unknown function (DUF2384)
VHHKVAGVTLPGILAEALAGRGRLPKLTNTDREPLESIRATAWTDDPDELRHRLRRHIDFDEDPDEGTFAWQGRELTPSEAETSRAQFRAMAKEQGFDAGVADDPSTPRRWIRGFIRMTDHTVSVDVNSRARLERVGTILRKLGASDLVVESRFDPQLDLAVPTGWRPTLRTGSPEAEDAWLRSWIDEEVPALGGITPRQASTDPEGAVLLERLLRRFEFDADLATAQGARGIDVARIRSVLGSDGVAFGPHIMR